MSDLPTGPGPPEDPAGFPSRHIGPRGDEFQTMLSAAVYERRGDLIDDAVPAQIRDTESLAALPDLPAARSEQEILTALRELSERNGARVQMIGQGYYDTVTPPVLRRNLLEDPSWYTAY